MDVRTTAVLPVIDRAQEPTAARTPMVVISSGRGLFDLGLADLYQYRDLLYFLVWRDVKVRYKQTAIGAGWAILQPFLTMVIFTVVFGHFAGIPSDGLPYPIFAFAALVPWTYFAQAISQSSGSLVGDAKLVEKVYFPRLVIPISAAVSPLVDLAAAFVVLLCMMGWFGIAPGWRMLYLPAFVLLALASALAVSLWLSALNVKYRDVRYTIPFLIQLWLYASPVAYPASMVPEQWRLLYSLNPMVGVIEGFRAILLGNAPPNVTAVAVSAAVVAIVLVAGIVYFRQMERTFADLM
jgi:lipopolysaccharide transport system permease protein